MSSLVLGGPTAQLLLLGGGTVQVTGVAQSALTSGQLALTSGQRQNQEFVTAEGNVDAQCKAYGSYGASELVWVVGANEEWQVLGIDSQPLILTPVLVSALVP